MTVGVVPNGDVVPSSAVVGSGGGEQPSQPFTIVDSIDWNSANEARAMPTASAVPSHESCTRPTSQSADVEQVFQAGMMENAKQHALKRAHASTLVSRRSGALSPASDDVEPTIPPHDEPKASAQRSRAIARIGAKIIAPHS